MSTLLKTFGKLVREARKVRGLTQEALAERAGLHPTFIGGVERGVKNPSIKSVKSIADALEINMRDLFVASQEDVDSDPLRDEILRLTVGRTTAELSLAAQVLSDVLSWTKKHQENSE